MDFIGDIDGDGFDDLAVGAPRGPYSPGVVPAQVSWEGSVYVFLSSDFASLDPAEAADWTPSIGLATPSSSCPTSESDDVGYVNALACAAIELRPGAFDPGTSTPSQNKQYFGWSVSRAGDFDGDGTPDFVIGAPGENDRDSDAFISTLSDPGRAYIISGATLANIASASPAGADPVVVDASTALCAGLEYADLLGSGPRDRFGFSVSYSDDVNGDGHDDVIVGAPQFVWLGRSGGIETNLSDHAGPGYVKVFFGYDSTDPAFDPLTSIPDPIEISGSWFLSEEDYDDPAALDPPLTVVDTQEPSYGEAFGFSVAGRVGGLWSGAGDPKRWDLVAGAPLLSTPSTDASGDLVVGNTMFGGQSVDYVLFETRSSGMDAYGRASVWVIDDADPSGAGTTELFEQTGASDRERLGWTIASIDDWTGDGVDDIATHSLGFTIDNRITPLSCAAPCLQEYTEADSTAEGEACGALWIIDPGASTVTVLPQVIVGQDPKDSVGFAIGRIGDITGDGNVDLLTSAARWPGDNSSPELDENGRVYIFHGE